ncbi:MAG: pilus assembly protein PilM, partial [Acidimicrobiales bacterium]
LETFVSEDNQEMVRVLVVAAQRDMVSSLLSAVRYAGLKPTTIDIVPFALVRGAATLTHLEELSGGAEAEDSSGDYIRDDSSPFALDLDGQPEARGEAIVNIGAGVTTVVVHEYGIPRFIRIITQGGLAITEAIQDDLGISLDEAEGLKRQVVAGDTESEEAQAAFRAMSARLGSLLDEIQGSLEYYVAQNETGPLERLVLTGGGSRIPGMSDRLQALLGVEVRRADALATIRLGKTGLTPEQLEDAQDLLPVPIGLALSGLPTA